MLSFTVSGTPSSADSGAPSRQRRSLASAAARAVPSSRLTTALISGLTASSRSRHAWSASTGETSFRRKAEERSRADQRQRSCVLFIPVAPVLDHQDIFWGSHVAISGTNHRSTVNSRRITT